MWKINRKEKSPLRAFHNTRRNLRSVHHHQTANASMTVLSPSKEGPFSYGPSFWVDIRNTRERRATPARIQAALNGKVARRKFGRIDEKETWYISQVLHYGLGPSKTTKKAARQRFVEATKEGKLKVPQPIMDIEKRLKEDYKKRLGREQRPRGEHKAPAMDATWPTIGLNTDYACKGVIERSWNKDYEAERQGNVRRRQEKYKVGWSRPAEITVSNASPYQATKINGSLKPLEGTWKLDTINIMDESYDPRTLTFRRDGQKLWGAFEINQFYGILLVDPLPSEASNTPLPCFWRGRDTREGEMQWLESECTGEVAFLGGGKIMGCLNLSGDLEFTGSLVANMGEPARTTKNMEKEWRGYNQKAHAREEVTRWSGRW